VSLTRPPFPRAKAAVHQCFGLSDEGVEDAIYDRRPIRRFVGINLAREGRAGCGDVVGVSPPAAVP
jgi:hypothetical protein